MRNYRGVLAFVSTFAILFFAALLPAPAHAGTSFSDVLENVYYTVPVIYAEETGWIEAGTHFRPGDFMTRCDLAMIVIKAKGITPPSAFTSTFKDVTAVHLVAPYVYAGVQAGYWSGYKDGSGNFGCNDTLLRAELAVIISNTLGLTAADEDTYTPEDTTPNWALPFIRRVHKAGSMHGMGDGTNFGATVGLNRADTVTALYKVYGDVVPAPESGPEPTPELNSATCNRINNTGGDGSYSACVGDTITHSPSGLMSKVLSFDDSKLTLFMSGMPGNNETTLSIYKNNFGYVGGNDGYEVIYKYGGYSPSTGANIFLTSKALINPPVVTTSSPVITPAVITSNVPKKFLTLITVISTQTKYDSWGNWIRFNENDDIQLFKVIIWDNDDPTAPKKIGLYKFDRTYDPYKEEYYAGGTAWINYRESFNILNVDIPAPPPEKIGTAAVSSQDYLTAFKLIMETIVKNQPAEHYGIKFLGHGNGDVALFEWKINPSDSALLLAYINGIIGKKVDFLDWNTNCGVGTYKVALGQYRYADYILASDLIRGGYTLYSDIPVDSIKLAHDEILETFFSPGKTIKQSLIDMVNSERTFWEKALKGDMIAKQLKQSISIYDTSKFEALMASANLEQGIKSDYIDVLEYVRKNYPALEQKFYDFRFHYVSNKDFFPWDYDFNGLRY